MHPPHEVFCLTMDDVQPLWPPAASVSHLAHHKECSGFVSEVSLVVALTHLVASLASCWHLPMLHILSSPGM